MVICTVQSVFTGILLLAEVQPLFKILSFAFLQWPTVASKSWFSIPLPSTLTLIKRSVTTWVSLFLSFVTIWFCTENVRSQSAVCNGKAKAKQASFNKFGKSSLWFCAISCHRLTMLSLGYFIAKTHFLIRDHSALASSFEIKGQDFWCLKVWKQAGSWACTFYYKCNNNIIL